MSSYIGFDASAFPHLIEFIAASCPTARRKLRSTCSALRRSLKSPYTHVMVSTLPHDETGNPPFVLSLLGAREATSAADEDVCMSHGDFAEIEIVDYEVRPVTSMKGIGGRGSISSNDKFDVESLRFRMVRHANGGDCLIKAAGTNLIVEDMPRDEFSPRCLFSAPMIVSPKLVIAFKFAHCVRRVIPIFKPPAPELLHLVLHFTLLPPSTATQTDFTYANLHWLQAQVRWLADTYDGPQPVVDLVDFHKIPHPRNKRCQPDGRLEGLCDRPLQDIANLKTAWRQATVNILTIEEYTDKYSLATATVALEKGDNFPSGRQVLALRDVDLTEQSV